MAFLTIAGTSYPVQTQSAQENESEYVGEKVRAFANNLRSTRLATSKKRSWAFVLGPFSRATYNALRAATDGDVAVNISGDALDGAVVSSIVSVASGQYLRDALGFLMVAQVTIEEV